VSCQQKLASTLKIKPKTWIPACLLLSGVRRNDQILVLFFKTSFCVTSVTQQFFRILYKMPLSLFLNCRAKQWILRKVLIRKIFALILKTVKIGAIRQFLKNIYFFVLSDQNASVFGYKYY
jgi:ABC-type nitrate/sulfonate/bicarbonate transport system permease component